MATWTCPYCQQKEDSQRASRSSSTVVNVGRLHRASLQVMGCHNPDCLGITLTARLYQRSEADADDKTVLGQTVQRWPLIPISRARPWPEYVHQTVRDDYTEACAIESTSPKASAALARRCLQALIRDFYGVSKATLVAEIDALEGEVGDDVLSALHALRKIANVGAHPERDPSIIVDIELGEATAMIDLIELLIDETYIARHQRQERLARVKAIAKVKDAAKTAPPKT